uniref:Dual specificity phosphatase 13A n=1 Tax=Gasterosteus aculeatus aculeatus TaxID=481459 RepID=G3NC16_GASAC
ENIRQWRIRAHVGHPLVHYDHDEGREPKDKNHIDGAQHCLPVLWIQAPRLLLELPVGVLVILLPNRRRVSAVTVSARVTVTHPVQTAPGAVRRLPVEGETQLLQHVDVLLLQLADRHHQPLDVPEHLELQRRRAEVILAEGEQAGAVQPVLVAQQVHVVTEALFPQPLGDVFGRPATDTRVAHFLLALKAGEKEHSNQNKTEQLSCHVSSSWLPCQQRSLKKSVANDRYGLWKLGVTHVLNAAHGRMNCQGSHDFYGSAVDYYGVPADDSPSFDLSRYFFPSAEYIQSALETDGARVFVHCAVGVSRSASLVLAYLMIQHHYTLLGAINKVKERRWIFPNGGFLRQLCALERKLRETS